MVKLLTRAVTAARPELTPSLAQADWLPTTSGLGEASGGFVWFWRYCYLLLHRGP